MFLKRLGPKFIKWEARGVLGLAMRMRNMRMMRIMRICGICGCVCGLKISSTLSTYEYLPKMATFWARNGSAWLCFQFWVPKISLLFIPPGFIHPQEWKLRVQNHKILVKKIWFFFTIDAVYAHWCASDAHRCASAKIGAWPTLVSTSNCFSLIVLTKTVSVPLNAYA